MKLTVLAVCIAYVRCCCALLTLQIVNKYDGLVGRERGLLRKPVTYKTYPLSDRGRGRDEDRDRSSSQRHHHSDGGGSGGKKRTRSRSRE